MTEDIVRVLRIVEYVGPRKWVEETIDHSLHGTKEVNKGCKISAATIGSYPEILEPLPKLTNEVKSHELC